MAGVRIVAYVVPVEGDRLSIVALKTFCGRALPSYMNPDVFVQVDVLPRTSMDKIDYQRLLFAHIPTAAPASDRAPGTA